MTPAMLAIVLLWTPGFAEETATDHYDLLAEGIDAKDTGAALEALHAKLAEYFGSAPKERLRLEVYSTKARFAAAMRADGETPPDAGGYYSPNTKKAYLWVQPSEYFTRQLVLHEATHQFHYLVATGNRRPRAGWYTEGLAEYFGMHDWDGETLAPGVIPPVTLEDYPARAFEQFAAAREDLEGALTGARTIDRPFAWAIVHWLVNKRPRTWHRLARALDAGRRPLDATKQCIGEVTPMIVAEFRTWLRTHQQPWRIAWVGWQGRGERIEGVSGTNALALMKERPPSLRAEIDGLGPHMWAGVAFGYRSIDEFWLVQAAADGTARVVQRTGGRWKIQAQIDAPADGAPSVEVACDGDLVTTTVNGENLGTFEAPGDIGLNVDSGRVRFRVDAGK